MGTAHTAKRWTQLATVLLAVPISAAGVGAAGQGTAAASQPYVLTAETNHSNVAFSVPIVGGITRVTGKFNDFSAEIRYYDQDITKSSVTVKIKAASINTGIEARDQDLRGPKFFDVANHPELTFQSRRVERRGENLMLVGDLTIRGVTRSVELSFTINGVQRFEGDRVLLGASARAKINRQQFGVGSDWVHSAIPNFIGDDVSVEIDLWTRRGSRQPAAVKGQGGALSTFNFAADIKPTKGTARNHLRMMLEINERYFASAQNKVTYQACHQGAAQLKPAEPPRPPGLAVRGQHRFSDAWPSLTGREHA